MARVFRSLLALADVEESALHIGEQDPAAAFRFLDALDETLRVLARNPRMGSPREFENEALAGVRCFPVHGFSKHLVFYRPRDGVIEVLRVLHGARDLGAEFEG